jgi:hypothetical protein
MRALAGPAIPRIISVDDHVVEPPSIWTDRVPARLLEQAPKVVRCRSKMHASGGRFDVEFDRPEGAWGDWWSYDDKWVPLLRLHAAAHC